MKKKVGTLLDESLIYQAKKVAVSKKQPLSQLLEDALRMYLLSMESKTRFGRKHVSQSTRGSLSISPSVLKKIMEEEGVYET